MSEGHSFLAGLLTVTLDGQTERGTTRILGLSPDVSQKTCIKWTQFAPKMYGRHKERTPYVEVSEVCSYALFQYEDYFPYKVS